MTREAGCEGLEVFVEDDVVTARLNRPDDNLISPAICVALTRLLMDPPKEAHVLLIEAAGPSFCLGRDRGATDAGAIVAEVDQLIDLNRALERTPLVTVARVQGPAAGFGAGLAALCDVTVALRDRGSFCFPEIRMGLAPTLVLTWLSRAVGRREAFRLTATGEEVAGDELVRLGLVNEVVDDETGLDAAVARWIATLRRHQARPHAEIRRMLADLEGVADKDYSLSASRLVLGSLRRGT